MTVTARWPSGVKEDATDDPPVIGPRHTVRPREMPLDPAHLIIKSLIVAPSRAAMNQLIVIFATGLIGSPRQTLPSRVKCKMAALEAGGDIGDIPVPATSGKLTKSTSARIRTCIVHRNVETGLALLNFKRKAFDFVHPSKICWDTERRTLCHAAAPLSGM
jgi:hypothetical protein